MFDLIETELISKEKLADRAKELNQDSFRIIQIHCVKTVEEMFLIYSFEKLGFELTNLRLAVTDGESLPSISEIFPHACLYENEINELFGLNITGMAIDFKGTFYETAKPHIFAVKEG
ncbi:MAG: NADH-quinone oxidoreductase subunit C [Peptococcaceae bacterium]|nr:NADH-quinone oxidoreductase subunit C [Peptococcaceae bacterium]